MHYRFNSVWWLRSPNNLLTDQMDTLIIIIIIEPTVTQCAIHNINNPDDINNDNDNINPRTNLE